MDLTNYIQDRNEAFISMDKDKILAYCEKYKISVPENEEIFWTGVHKVICNLFLSDDSPISIEQYNKSYEWLIEHGYTPSLFQKNRGEK